MQTAAVEVNADPQTDTENPDRRRRAGYELLALALIAALCLPGLLGRRTTGTATPAPPAAPPVAGQCRAPVERDVELDQLTGTALIDCSERHSAEIVAVTIFPAGVPYPDSTSARAVVAAVSSCRGAVEKFVGATTSWQPGAPVPPAPPETVTQISVPGPHEWESGQRWYACQVRPAPDALPIGYTGSVGQAATGDVPAAYGRCAGVIGGPAVPCAEPHNAQKISLAVISRDRIDCREVAQQLTGSPDPSYGGALSQTGWQEADGRVACWSTTTSGRPLLGSLIGWGDRPLTTG